MINVDIILVSLKLFLLKDCKFVRIDTYKRIRELLNVSNIFARVDKIFLLLKLCWRAAVVQWATPQMLGPPGPRLKLTEK